MPIKNFINSVFIKLNITVPSSNSTITDEVFLFIQNDHELMYDYLKLVEANTLKTVNQKIGRAIKEKFGLTNDDCRQNSPKSTLIQSHQIFE